MNKIPFMLLLVLVAFFAVPLLKGKNPQIVESALIGKPAPAFTLPAATTGTAGLSDKNLRGHASLVNFFASWCVECRIEHATLEKISSEENIPVYGIDYKDTPEKLAPWLKRHGNPYAAIGADRSGRTAIDWGVYGVPETFIVDAGGIIRYKHVGAVTDKVYREIFKPLLAELKK